MFVVGTLVTLRIAFTKAAVSCCKASFKTQSVHIHCRHTISAHLFFRDFSFPPLLCSHRLSLSLLLSLTVFLFSHPLAPLSVSPSRALLISLSLTPPFLSFHLRLFNLFLCTEHTVYYKNLDLSIIRI